jgi:SPP1 gp7 family putative phage head morphogenesis protein
MKKDLWTPKRRIEEQYRKSLKQITDLIQKSVDGITDPFEIIARLKTLVNNPALNSYAESTALKMVTHLFTDAGRTWRAAASVNSKGRTIYEALKKELQGPIKGSFYFQVKRNAQIIKSMPGTTANKLTAYIADESLKGRRASEIAEDIRKRFPSSTESNINLIARTEVSKTSTALTRARSEDIGLEWYIWRTSEDARVRKSHDHMEDVLVRWTDAPSPEKLIGERSVGNYHAGEVFNCRCYPEPLIGIDYIKWPHKVYYAGRIQTMTRKQFEQIQ